MIASSLRSTERSNVFSFSLNTHRRQALERSWAGVFRDHVLPQLPVEALAACFARTKQGRPRKDFRLILGVLLLQQPHDCTDAATVEAVTFNFAWRYALALPPGANISLCERTLRNYRRVVITHRLEERLFRSITDTLVQACAADPHSQHIDSTVVRSAMRTLTRLGIVVATVRKFLRELAHRYPTLSAMVDRDVIRLYGERRGTGCFALTKPQESQRRLPEAVTTLDTLVRQFAETEATTLASYHLLTRVLTEQCERGAGSASAAPGCMKDPAQVPCDSLQNPADPDASYNAQRGQGYMVQIMETYTEDDQHSDKTSGSLPPPDFITHVAVHKMMHHDGHALEPALTDTRQRHLSPARLLGDSHYGSISQVKQYAAEGLTLIAPAMPPKGAQQGKLTLEDFQLDPVGRVIACPQGHAPVWISVSTPRREVRFDPTLCAVCPVQERCPAAKRTGCPGGRWQYTLARVEQYQRRQAEQAEAFTERYRWRAGIEGTMSRLKHHMQLAYLRVRGMGAVRYAVFLRALGLNIYRVAAWRRARASAAVLCHITSRFCHNSLPTCPREPGEFPCRPRRPKKCGWALCHKILPKVQIAT
jgi:hypothetical protein